MSKISGNNGSESSFISRIPWTESRYENLRYPYGKPLTIEVYQEEYATNANYFEEEEDVLFVCWRVDYRLKKVLLANNPDAKVFFFNGPAPTVKNLGFMGREYKFVVLIIGQKIEAESKTCLSFLYNTISRSTERVHVICHEESYAGIKNILTFSDEDLIDHKKRSEQDFEKRVFTHQESKHLSKRQVSTNQQKNLDDFFMKFAQSVTEVFINQLGQERFIEKMYELRKKQDLENSGGENETIPNDGLKVKPESCEVDASTSISDNAIKDGPIPDKQSTQEKTGEYDVPSPRKENWFQEPRLLLAAQFIDMFCPINEAKGGMNVLGDKNVTPGAYPKNVFGESASHFLRSLIQGNSNRTSLGLVTAKENDSVTKDDGKFDLLFQSIRFVVALSRKNWEEELRNYFQELVELKLHNVDPEIEEFIIEGFYNATKPICHWIRPHFQSLE